MSNSLIIIPTYNERDNIESLLEEIYKVLPETHILIVDDNSPDKTHELVECLIEAKYQNKVFLYKRAGKLGLGTAYLEGFYWALARPYAYIIQMDADFSHNPKYLPDFLEAIKNNDLVIGSRYIKGGAVKNWGVLRKIISRGGSLYSRMILGLPLRDITGGYKCFRRTVLELIPLDQIRSNGYSFQIELNYIVYLKGLKIKEIPIIFEDRVLNQSKMSKKIFLEAVLKVLFMRLNKKNYLKTIGN